MNRHAGSLLLAWAITLFLIGFTVAWALGDEVVGGIAFDTSPFACDGHAETRTWRSPFDFTMRITRVRIVHGRDYGTTADYHSQVVRDDGSWLAWFSQDAYSEAGSRQSDTTYDGHYQVLAPGQSMELTTICRQFGGDQGRGHTIVAIWFAKEAF